MSPRQPPAVDEGRFDEFEVARLTWVGLVVAALGWALMLGEAGVADLLPGHGARAAAALHGDLIEIAKCIIVSGFGLAILGALQTGFGTLNRFFSAVLMRSNRPVAAAASAPSAPAPHHAAPRGRRPYRTLPDGSVEVETIVGTRRFATMREAAEFI